ncbi:hypothetical protein P9112_009021 [Eukaryota sp. TZLM1-RC]
MSLSSAMPDTSFASPDASGLPLVTVSDFSDRLDGNDMVCGAVGGGVLAFARSDGTVVTYEPLHKVSLTWELSRRSHSRGEVPFSIRQIFIDPSGRHLIVSASPPQLFYIYNPTHTEPAKKSVPLKLKTNNHLITSVGWLYDEDSNTTLTSSIVLGSSEGKVFEIGLEGSVQKCKEPLTSLEDCSEIFGISARFFNINDQISLFLIIATCSRIYEFTGHNQSTTHPNLSKLFQGHGPRFNELPRSADVTRSQLSIRIPLNKVDPWRLCWITSVGIYLGSLQYTSMTSDSMITDNKLIPYPSNEVPLSVIATEFHLLLCYSFKIVVFSLVSEEIVSTLSKDCNGVSLGELVSFAGDSNHGIFFYGSKKLYRLTFHDESRDVWKYYADQKNYQKALEFCSSQAHKDHIMVLEGQDLFDQKNYSGAARRWARAGKSIEEVSLAFIDVNANDALLEFLIERLSFVLKNSSSEYGDKVHSSMLSLWIVDIYLSRMASANSNRELEDLEFEFRDFLSQYKESLHKSTTYELITSHGRVPELVYFAKEIGDYEKVIDLLLQDSKYSEAIQVIKETRDSTYLYKYSPTLIRELPSELITTWSNWPNLDIKKLVPSVLLLSGDVSIQTMTKVVMFLEKFIYIEHDYGEEVEPCVVNLLVSFYSELDDDTRLIGFLSDDKVSQAVDLQYALRVCASRSKTEASVRIYAVLGLYEEAVDLSLKAGDVELAKVNANLGGQEDSDQLKKLWLKIAEYVIEKNQSNVEIILDFLRCSECLRIEDVLPLLGDFTVIGQLKDELLSSLEGYGQEIKELNDAMDRSAKSADLTRKSLKDLKNRAVEVSDGEPCLICRIGILHAPFYVFPCSHKFHSQCLLEEVEGKFSNVQRSILSSLCADLKALDDEIHELESTMLTSEEVLDRIDRLQLQRNQVSCRYDSIIASECPVCGEFAISSIDKPLDVDNDGWSLKELTL